MPSPATHLRAPLLWLLVPLICGLTAAKLWPPPALGLLPIALLAGVATLFSLWLAGKSGRLAHAGWGLCFCLAVSLDGFVLLHCRQPGLHDWGARPPREVTVTLEVTQVFPRPPSARSLSGLGKVTRTSTHDRDLTGRRVYFSAIKKISLPPRRSGRYVVRGVLEALPHEADPTGFNDYLENLGIRQKLTRAQILREEQPPGRSQLFYERMETRLEKILSHGIERHPPLISLYHGMLLGRKAELSDEQQSAFMRSGTFHIFCIAGLHVGVIAVALRSLLLLLRVPRLPAAVLSLLLLWFYVQVTGANLPAVRAFVMITFWFAAQVFRLPGNGLAALTASALVTLLIEPLELFSTGFQMSYSVVLTLVALGAPLSERWQAAWRPFSYRPKINWHRYHHAIAWSGRWLLGAGAACWASFVGSTPSGIGNFHLFSPGSLVANLAIIPLASLAITSGFLSLLSGLVGLLSLSALFNSAAAVILLSMDWLVRHETSVPGFYFNAHFIRGWMAPAAVAALAAVLLAGVAGRWSRRYGGFWPPALLIGLILVFWVKFG
jgi:competence protein ComEC